MQVYNCDETGVSVVHRPGKVVAEVGRCNVYAITSAEKGKTHYFVVCVCLWLCFAPNDGISTQAVTSRKV